MMLYDVVVIGGGPAGSQVAYRMAGLGYRVVVVERKPELGEAVCCAGIISQECVRRFDVADSVILRRVSGGVLISPSGRGIRLERDHAQAVILDRGAFDRAMAQRAEEAGAEYVFGSRVVAVDVGEDGVVVEAVSGNERARFVGRVAVIACGFGSKLVTRLGLGKVADFVMAVQAEVETRGPEELAVYFGREVAPDFYAWVVPHRPRRALVGLATRRWPRYYLRKLLAKLVAEGRVVSADVAFSCRGIPLKASPRTYADRLLVVGDAAGQNKPTTGGGIYYGLLCADMAAGVLQSALGSDDLSARGLGAYQRQWRRKLGGEMRVDSWARRLFNSLSDRRIERVFEIIVRQGIDQALLQDEGVAFDWHSKAIARLLGYRAVTRAVEKVRVPLFVKRGGK